VDVFDLYLVAGTIPGRWQDGQGPGHARHSNRSRFELLILAKLEDKSLRLGRPRLSRGKGINHRQKEATALGSQCHPDRPLPRLAPPVLRKVGRRLQKVDVFDVPVFERVDHPDPAVVLTVVPDRGT
jgi:hypothetical protein